MNVKPQHLVGVGTSILAGTLIAFVVRINASLGQHLGLLESSFLIHFIGAVFALPIVLVWGRFSRDQLRAAPRYLLLGGVFGMLIVIISNAAVAHLGMVLTVGLFLVGNLLFAAVADHFCFFGLPVFRMTMRRAVGLMVAGVGLIFVLL
ncbi:MAG: DMT family transporter [Deltaproteobacteria bacterium]|nr:DMT family transporter [Deltaproteobacteria bacterium]